MIGVLLLQLGRVIILLGTVCSCLLGSIAYLGIANTVPCALNTDALHRGHGITTYMTLVLAREPRVIDVATCVSNVLLYYLILTLPSFHLFDRPLAQQDALPVSSRRAGMWRVDLQICTIHSL